MGQTTWPLTAADRARTDKYIIGNGERKKETKNLKIIFIAFFRSIDSKFRVHAYMAELLEIYNYCEIK